MGMYFFLIIILGEITRYVLVRDDLEIWSGIAFKHTDSFEILSYKEYKYIVKVSS